jgi:hypothetical protein
MLTIDNNLLCRLFFNLYHLPPTLTLPKVAESYLCGIERVYLLMFTVAFTLARIKKK